MPLPQYTDRTKLRIINSLYWRLQEAREIGHEVARREIELETALCNLLPRKETHADRRMADRLIARFRKNNELLEP